MPSGHAEGGTVDPWRIAWERGFATAQSHVESYHHLIWATTRRAQLLVPEVEACVYACARDEARRLGVDLYAINGLADHVHLVVSIPPTLSIAEVVRLLKGVSARRANADYRGEDYFRGQRGYAAYSLSRPHLRRVIDYVEYQKVRHAEARLWLPWEQTPDDIDDAGNDPSSASDRTTRP